MVAAPPLPQHGASVGLFGNPKDRRLLALLGAAVFVAFLCIAAWVFVMAQLLPPQDVWLAQAIPFKGFYGEDKLLPWLSYIQLLEGSALLSFLGLATYSYSRQERAQSSRRLLASLALPLKVFGLMVAAIVYTETHLLWGELWYGVKFLTVYPQGFPWGNERVATNTCFVQGANYVQSYGANCLFLNYDQLLLISVVAALVGFYLGRRLRNGSREGEQGSGRPAT